MGTSVEKDIAGFNNRLLASACRVNRISSEAMETGLKEALLDLAGILSADHVVLSRLSPEENKWTTAISHPVSGPCSSITKQFPSRFPVILEKIVNGDAVVLDNLPEELPPDAELERDLVEACGVRSILTLPVSTDDAVSHLLSIFYFQTACHVPSSSISLLQPAADFLASAHDRHRAALENEKMARIEALLDEISSAYINIPVDGIDRAVTQDLERLCRLMDADRYTIIIHEESDKDASGLFFSYTAGPENDKGQNKEAEAWVVEHGGHDLFRHITEHCLRGQHHSFYDVEELPDSEKILKEALFRLGVKSQLAVPISVSREVIGMMFIVTIRKRCAWPERLIQKVRQFGDLFANAYVRKQSEVARRRAHQEIQQLKARLESDYRYLSDEFAKTVGGRLVVGDSPAMHRAMEQVMQVAPTQTPVLLLGETGAGKGMLAMALHQASRRGNRPLVQLNCATLTPSLIESELFGHERGAFTGADRQRAGRFEIAEGTTLFLDEIGELPLSLQAKLLRVLETGEFERLGGSKTIKTDARIIAATNRDLEQEVTAGRFRKDLWYRLNIFPIQIPPLRERPEDIPAIVEEFLSRFSKQAGKHFSPIPDEVMASLIRHPWPGNVRELKNLIERASIVSPAGELTITVPKQTNGEQCPAPTNGVRPFAEMERSYLLQALGQTGGRIEGPGGAAALLGLNPSTLRSRMRRLGIRKRASAFE